MTRYGLYLVTMILGGAACLIFLIGLPFFIQFRWLPYAVGVALAMILIGVVGIIRTANS